MRRALIGLVALLGSGVVTATATVQNPPERRRLAPGQERPRDRRVIRTDDSLDLPVRSAVPAQDSGHQEELARAAAKVSRAWLGHDAASIVAESPQLILQLPGADPSAALGPQQAAALLSDFFAAAREVDVTVRSVREIEPGQGFAELARRYQVNGTQDVRDQSLFLGYRRERQQWILIELRVIEP